jgi:DNA polymerase-3 subunit epsilon
MRTDADRLEAAQKARDLLLQNPVYLDTETTGLGPGAEIVEFALVDQNGEPLFESLVRPKGEIEPEAMRLHGITMQMVHGAPTWQEIWPQVERYFSTRTVGVYNSEFDLRMMRQTHQKYWMRWNTSEDHIFCIMKLYARFFGEWDTRRSSFRWHSLDQAGKQCGISLPNSHRARDDARLARAVMHYMAGYHP